MADATTSSSGSLDDVDDVDGLRPARLRDLSVSRESTVVVSQRPARLRDRRRDPNFHRDDTPTQPLERHRDPSVPVEIEEQDRLAWEQRDDTPINQLRRRPSRSWRRVLFGGSIVFALLLGYYLVSLFQVYRTGHGDQARATDAIVVMGAAQYDGRPSPQLAARLDHVAEIWPQGLAPIVVVTGGNQPGDRFTEAESSAAYLIARGVPETSIVLEDDGATSYESLERVALILGERLRIDDASVLIVTDPYHSLRSRLIAEEVGLTAYTSPTDSSVVTGARSLERHVWEAGGVAIGRVTGFGWLDDLTD